MLAISTPALVAAPRLSVIQAQAALSKAQVELSSGKLADIGTGLGDQTGQYTSYNEQQGLLQGLTQGNATTTTRLSTTTTALDALRETANAFMSNLTEATTDGSIPTSLVVISSNNLDTLVSTLNTSTGNEYIFGGINSSVQPVAAYTTSPPSTTKQAVDDAFTSSFGVSQTSSDAGSISGADMQTFLAGSFSSLFNASSFSSTWSSASDTVVSSRISTTETVNSSVSANDQPFRQLAQAYTMVKEFGASNLNSAAGQAVLASATQLVSSAISGLTDIESGVGVSQAAVSDANDTMSTQINFLSSQASALVAVDPSILATQISELQTQIQASYEITSQLQQLSLVSYLK